MRVRSALPALFAPRLRPFGSRICHKSLELIHFSFLCLLFPRNDKKTAVSQAVCIHHIHLVLYMVVSTYLTSISRKVPPSKPPAVVTGASFLSAYLFALMYASAPEKFLHPSDNSSPVSSFKRITVACQSGILTPLPLVTLVAACRRFDNLSIKVHFYEQTVNDEYFLFSFD